MPKLTYTTNPRNRGLYPRATCLIVFRKISLFGTV